MRQIAGMLRRARALDGVPEHEVYDGGDAAQWAGAPSPAVGVIPADGPLFSPAGGMVRRARTCEITPRSRREAAEIRPPALRVACLLRAALWRRADR